MKPMRVNFELFAKPKGLGKAGKTKQQAQVNSGNKIKRRGKRNK